MPSTSIQFRISIVRSIRRPPSSRISTHSRYAPTPMRCTARASEAVAARPAPRKKTAPAVAPAQPGHPFWRKYRTE